MATRVVSSALAAAVAVAGLGSAQPKDNVSKVLDLNLAAAQEAT
jgi:hypothetical protein